MFIPSDGGLMSYGTELPDLFRRAAGYGDRIPEGENRPICRCRRRQIIG